MSTCRSRLSAWSGTLGAWHDEVIAIGDGRSLRLRLYGGVDGAVRPRVLHFHAGAFVGGSLDSGGAVARALVAAGALVASVDYPLAPAHPFPHAVEAGHAALAWLARQRRRPLASAAPIFVAGEEAGGNLAAAVALMARDRAGPTLAGQILLSPMLDVCVGSASQRDARAGPVGCPWADGWRAYLPQPDDVLHPYAAPGASLRLAGLPPTLLITAPDDPLRDETLAYGRRLRDAGVAVELALLPGPTGWPRSYLAGEAAPWTDALRERLRPFLCASVPRPAGHAAG